MVWDDYLDGVYLDAVSYNGKYQRILAGPGTGKTFSLIRKVCRLLEEGEDPKTIVLLTFTRVAAKDLQKKLVDIDTPDADEIRSGTLHSLAFSILANERVIEQMRRVPRPLLKHELKPLRQDLARELNLGLRQIDSYKELYESAWARLQTDQPGWAPTQNARRFERTLVQWLRFHNSMLIGELIPICLRYFQINPESPYRNQYEHIIVDEYQDLNRAEQVLIDEIVGDANLTIGGDDEQSIYGFKYAEPSGILSFHEEHGGTYDSVLVESRRCPISILRAANHLIGHENGDVRYLQHFVDNPPGEIQVLQWNGMQLEAQGIARCINHYIENQGINPGRILVLAPRKHIADRILSELNELELPTQSFYHNPLDNIESQKRFTLLSIAADPYDRVSLRFWLGLDSNTFLRGSYAKLAQYCTENQIEPYDALRMIHDGAIAIPRTAPLIQKFIDLVDQYQEIEQLSGMDLINRIFPDGLPECNQIRELAIEECDDDTQCYDLLENIRERLSQPADVPENRDSISVMSLHKAKGLEADLVAIVSCVEGLIPYIDPNGTLENQINQLEENRRLFYVGITRTRNVLLISNFLFLPAGQAESMKINFQRVRKGLGQVQASQFIHDLGPDCPRPIRGTDFLI